MTEPQRTGRATFPADYGARGGAGDDPLDWALVDQRIRDAPNYWIATAGDDGPPHARPIDAVWVDGALCFGGSPQARWVRNLQRDPAARFHLPSGDEVVILEGAARFVTDHDDPLAAASTEASRAKYPQYFAGGDPAPRPFWAFRPDVIYAWSLATFPKRATRWTFG